ncbi:thioredoxin family protein [Lutibacter sp.]|uniref:thioredoxin family protein n=1 Tax=Lutibacter sp. TaxID=1925666 RepID=UPI00356806CE
MRKTIVSVLFFFSIFILSAQNWVTDFNEAKKIATKKNQPIILVFQGSDWCAPCIKLNKEIWSTEEFKTYSEKNFVMLLADFPRKKKNELSDFQQQQNNQLMEKYNLQGYFPFVAVLDKKAKLLGNTGYKKISPSEYIKLLNSFKK